MFLSSLLVGRTDWAEEPRRWCLANVSEARLTGEAFERPRGSICSAAPGVRSAYFQERPFNVVLRFDAGAARDAPAFVPSGPDRRGEHRRLTEGALQGGGIDEMRRRLSTCGGSVTVEKPARLRRRPARMCASLAAHHSRVRRTGFGYAIRVRDSLPAAHVGTSSSGGRLL